MTYRRLRVFIDHLPPESATKTAIREALSPEDLLALDKIPRVGHGPWSKQEHLLAAVADRLGWVIYAIYGAAHGKPDKPKPIPRPGVYDQPIRSDDYYDQLRMLRENRGVVEP